MISHSRIKGTQVLLNGNSGIFRENMSGQRHTLVYLISIKMGMKKSFVITISMRTLGNAPILYLALNLWISACVFFQSLMQWWVGNFISYIFNTFSVSSIVFLTYIAKTYYIPPDCGIASLFLRSSISLRASSTWFSLWCSFKHKVNQMTRKSAAKNNVVLMLAADYVSLKYK